MHVDKSLLTHPIAVRGDKAECLTEIFRDEVNLVIWERSLSPECARFADRFAREAGTFERFLALEEEDSAGAMLPEWARNMPGAESWVRDVDEMIAMFQCLFEPAGVGVRLHVLRGTMCPRFHYDRVPARLLVTYTGPGTEWLPEAWVRRGDSSRPLPEQAIGHAQIERIPTAAVSLLKGASWVGNEGHGLVHRSPEPDGVPRLVLGLDWLS
ncbi:uncharacterized protein DUF1826 [Tamilnaduibacter salinus]|uniref:Uncharacterized protein DUF1826 n=1 Tax=Tamilnaduibacter salinus TaxID=1484056 RepID=A0A2A2I4X9_9GAMM|nr:DUF1826 domain-containing protein [Tamilnaduibacter salinus]PAV26185.1 hypothetical protein CF392_07355 [Tamilnaduibacter salinus]PVY70077.1 uncharacterized protein DUF1826 [Tamilnaduibacter salinus]